MQNYIFVIVLGLMIGSFLNVCIYRIPNEESILFPRSHCITCGHVLGSLELIPIISYLFLGGRCKHCKNRISARYMSIELFTGICFGIVYYRYGLSIETVLGCTFVAFATVLTMIDWDEMILPTSIIRLGIGIGLIERIVQASALGSCLVLVGALMGAVAGYLLMMLIFYGSRWLLKKEGMGYGDVRLMGMIGLFVGLQTLFLAILISSILASIYGIVALKIKMKNEPYPLGPFLNIGGVLVFLWGHNILTTYLNLFIL